MFRRGQRQQPHPLPGERISPAVPFIQDFQRRACGVMAGKLARRLGPVLCACRPSEWSQNFLESLRGDTSRSEDERVFPRQCQYRGFNTDGTPAAIEDEIDASRKLLGDMACFGGTYPAEGIGARCRQGTPLGADQG
jgi:hypothetical protein